VPALARHLEEQLPARFSIILEDTRWGLTQRLGNARKMRKEFDSILGPAEFEQAASRQQL
jgi:hypothetical protein